MSTSALSASTWIAQTNPSNQQIEQMIAKLQHRIEHSGASDDALLGSIEALDVLSIEIERRQNALNNDAVLSPSAAENALDFGSLGEPAINLPPKATCQVEKNSRLDAIKQAIRQIESN